MANPNIYTSNSIIGDTVTQQLTATLTTTLLSGQTNKILKINTIIVANIDGVNAASFDLYLNDGANTRAFAYQVTVPAQAVVVIIDRNSGFYLTESQTIEGGASLPNDLTVMFSYETISEVA